MNIDTSKKRLSREESREQTRQRLLEAAAIVIPREGYQGASVEDIAAEAGFSRGAFYSNFEDKDELFTALLQQLCDAEHAALDEIFEQGGSAEEMRLKIREFYAQVCREQQQLVLYSEAKIHAARDDAFRQRFNELERETRQRITGFVTRYCEEYGQHDNDKSHAQIATGLVALIHGVSFAQMIDPEEITEDVVQSVLTLFFDAVIKDGV
ncbi:MAG TPA: TetR/AcrR family transcriptional regulator [Gammaproteobacteria bacterium]|nr:TetR/AcrR family transcriptional regulator [Gammaproteobacteria bacterium]